MPIDSITATGIAAIGKWMWASYGKKFVDGWAEGIGSSREKRQLRNQWQTATQTYLEKLYDQVNWLRLLGKKEGMLLERIYTDLNVLDQPTAERWYDRTMLEKDYVQRRSFHSRREAERQDGLKTAQQFNRLYILGKPGAGKTTFMKFMTLETLRGKLGKKIPIFVTLKELSDKGQKIVLFMAEQFRQCGFKEAEGFVRQLLQAGQAVVLFDGLDEVNLENEKRATLISALKDFVDEFEKCQVLITCRIAASDYSFARFKYVEMADFSEEQQKRFIFKWFQDDMVRRDACWQALADSKSANLRELAHVPLLLTLLCITYERRGEFPPDRDEVYRTAVNALLFEWDGSRLIQRDAVYEGLDVKYRERLLAWIAYETFSRSDYLLEEAKLAALIETYLATVPRIQAEVDGLSVLKTIEAQHGLLVERAQGIYSFSHLTLQEYFTARYVVDNAQEILPKLMQHVGEDPWREVFLLTAGMLYGADTFAQQYLQALTRLVAGDVALVAYLQWGAEKSAGVKTSIQPAAARAFFFFNTFVSDFALAIARGTILEIVLNLIIGSAGALALALDRAFANVHERSITVKRDLDRTIASGHASALFFDLGVTYDLRLLALKLRGNPTEVMQQLQTWSVRQANLPEWLTVALAGVIVPDKEALHEEWITFNQAMEMILLRYWGLEQFWAFSDEQLRLLSRYIAGTRVLVDCLQVATVQDRATIEAQLLLPPEGKEIRD